jgi:hypothetical protein
MHGEEVPTAVLFAFGGRCRVAPAARLGLPRATRLPFVPPMARVYGTLRREVPGTRGIEARRLVVVKLLDVESGDYPPFLAH